MTTRLLTVLSVLFAIVVGATAHAADQDRLKALKKRPDGKAKYFKALTGGHSEAVKAKALKPENKKIIDVTAKIQKGTKLVAKRPAKLGKNRAAFAARSMNKIREVQVVRVDAKTYRARPDAVYADAQRSAAVARSKQESQVLRKKAAGGK